LSEAFSKGGMWLQGLILVLLKATRLATSTDADADTFVRDFGGAPAAGDPVLFERLPATYATTSQTLGRLSATGQVVIELDVIVQTQDGSLKYVVIADPTNGAFDASQGGYVMADGIGALVCKVQCTTLGAAGNVPAGAINTIGSAIPGISTTSNASAVANGYDAEKTPAMRVRWRRFIGALRRATKAALEFAVTSLQRGVSCGVEENTHADGTTEKGFNLLIVDDGSGFPPSSLLTAASAAADETHGAGTSYGVTAPTVVLINVAATLVTVAGGDHAGAILAATGALQAYLNSLPRAATVAWSRVWQVLQDSHPDIAEVTGLSVNGGSVDITMTFIQVAKTGTLTIA
jgi:uncharacterized phage protein gp47/JayE